MKDRYLKCVENAKEKYSRQQVRAGYVRGWFSWLRHWGCENSTKVSNLITALNTDSENNPETLIRNHLHSNSFNNHSYNAYLLDELLGEFKEVDWQQFNPKPIVFYQGELFRGTSAPPQTIFANGFKESATSASLDDYISDVTGSYGISTSKNVSVAKQYALPRIRKHDYENLATQFSNVGYVYVIDYRGCEGIDIVETLTKRENNFRTALARPKAEVNVLGSIKSGDIVGVWKCSRDPKEKSIYTANPNYVKNRPLETSPLSKLIIYLRDWVCGKSPSRKMATVKHPGLTMR